MLNLTPAYDICPQPRSGGEVTQALAISRSGDKRSRLQVCEVAAEAYQLGLREAREIIEHTVAIVEDKWAVAADAVGLSGVERARLLRGAILNPSIFYRDEGLSRSAVIVLVPRRHRVLSALARSRRCGCGDSFRPA